MYKTTVANKYGNLIRSHAENNSFKFTQDKKYPTRATEKSIFTAFQAKLILRSADIIFKPPCFYVDEDLASNYFQGSFAEQSTTFALGVNNCTLTSGSVRW